MRWKTKEKRVGPKEGDGRIVTEFAWLPVVTADGYTVWLEKYDSVQVYGWYSVDIVERYGMKWCTTNKWTKDQDKIKPSGTKL